MSGVESVHIKQIVQSVLLRVNGESRSHIIIYYLLPQIAPPQKKKTPRLALVMDAARIKALRTGP
jgi:hypothetical protein